MALIIGFKLQCTKSIIIYEHINLLSSLDLESLWPDVDGGCLASAMRNNFCVCIFDFLSRFCANAALSSLHLDCSERGKEYKSENRNKTHMEHSRI